MKFNKLVFAIFISALLLVQSVGCSRPSATTPTQAFQIPDNFTTYTDENSLYSISYPNQWEPMSESDLAAVYSQVKDAINDIKSGLPIEKASMLFLAGLRISTGYYPSINIIVEPASTLVANTNMALQAEINGLKQLDPNYQEVSRTKLKINGKDAIIFEYKAHFSSSTPLMHNVVIVCLSGRTIWTMTCSASDADFSTYSSNFNNIARSLKINK